LWGLWLLTTSPPSRRASGFYIRMALSFRSYSSVQHIPTHPRSPLGVVYATSETGPGRSVFTLLPGTHGARAPPVACNYRRHTGTVCLYLRCTQIGTG
jgi:hypothetical protein